MQITKHRWGASIELSPFEAEVLNFIVRDHTDTNADEQDDFYADNPSDLAENGKNWYPGMTETQRRYFVSVRQAGERLANEFERVLGAA